MVRGKGAGGSEGAGGKIEGVTMSDDTDKFLVHRDDIDADLFASLEAKFQDLYPGFKVVCAGDKPGELPEEMAAVVNGLQAAMMDSMVNGTCLDCGTQMPGFPPEDTDEAWEAFKIPEGWSYYKSLAGDGSGHFVCDRCEKD